VNNDIVERKDFIEQFGLSYTNGTFIYPKIPKCASTWAEIYLTSLGWNPSYFHLAKLSDLPALIFLREPKDRWISGVCEFLFRYHNSLYYDATTSIETRNRIFDVIFDNLCMDEHTAGQTFFIRGLSNPIYFKVDKSLSDSVASFLGTKVNKNIMNSRTGRVWTNLMFDYLADNNLATEKLDLYLKTDYDLFNTVRFN